MDSSSAEMLTGLPSGAQDAAASHEPTDWLDVGVGPAPARARWWYRLLPRWLRNKVAPAPHEAPDADSVAIGGVVRLLCDVRLVALLACGFEMLAAGTQGATDPRLVLLLVLLPFSYVPLRSWSSRGGLFTESTILARCDIILTLVTVIFCLDIQSVGLYAAAGVAMIGVIHGTRWALVAAPPIAFIQLNGMMLLGSFSATPMVVLLPVVTLSMAWCGGRLGSLLRDQARTRRQARNADSRAAAAEERLRLARNLHDTVVGEIAGLQWLVVRFKEVAAQGDPEERVRLAETMDAACAIAYADSRLMLDELRTSSPESELNTGPDLESRIESWSQRHSINATYEIAPEVGLLSARLKLEAQAIVSELLENVRRHSYASKVIVRGWVEDMAVAEVVIEVSDNGVGFPSEFDPGSPRTDGQSHYGLRGIRERVAAYGGRLEIEAAVPRGACIRVRLKEPSPGKEMSIGASSAGKETAS